MNVYQMVFLPPILSIAIDNLTNRINKLKWIKWSDSLLQIYIFEIGIWALVSIYIILGAGL